MAVPSIEITEEEINLNLERTSSIQVENNALIFGNTVYQISNISRVTVRKFKKTQKDIMPGIFLLLWLFCGAFVASASSEPRAKLLGFLIAIVGLFLYFDSRISRDSYIYYLVIELNSGAKRLFRDESQDFLKKVAYRLCKIIQDPNYAAPFIADFTNNKIINIYNDHSTQIEGDVLNSFINSGIASGVQGRWSA